MKHSLEILLLATVALVSCDRELDSRQGDIVGRQFPRPAKEYTPLVEALRLTENPQSDGLVLAPVNLGVTGVTSREVTLEFGYSQTTNSFVVERSYTGLGDWTAIGTIPGNQRLFKDKALSSDSTFYCRL